jgi:hypothetical protein
MGLMEEARINNIGANNMENEPLCHAHSGIVSQIRIGGSIIGALMIIFCALLSIVWSEQKSNTKEIMTEIKSTSATRDGSLSIMKEKIDEIWKEQLRLKWVIEEKDIIKKK